MDNQTSIAGSGILLNMLGYGRQCWQIHKKKSSESISLPAFFANFCTSLVTVVYGTNFGDKLFTVNAAVCGIGQIVLLRLAFGNRRLKWWELTSCAGLLGLVVSAFVSPVKWPWFLAVNAVAGLVSWAQPMELLQSGTKGNVSGLALFCFLSSGGCWWLYCFLADYSAAQLTFAGFCFYQAVTIYLWYRARD